MFIETHCYITFIDCKKEQHGIELVTKPALVKMAGGVLTPSARQSTPKASRTAGTATVQRKLPKTSKVTTIRSLRRDLTKFKSQRNLSYPTSSKCLWPLRLHVRPQIQITGLANWSDFFPFSHSVDATQNTLNVEK